MDEQTLSLKQVEFSLPLEFLIKALAYADYDHKSKLSWAVGNETHCENRIQSWRSANKLKLLIDQLSFSVKGGCHVCDIGEPILQGNSSDTKSVNNVIAEEISSLEPVENEKQSQTVVTIKPHVSEVQKRKVGRPRKVQGQAAQPGSRANSCITPTNVHDDVSTDNQSTSVTACTESVLQSVDVKELNKHNENDLQSVKRKRYSLRGVKLNSYIMGAVKGIDTLGEEMEDMVDEADDNADSENFVPSDPDADSDYEMKNCHNNSPATQRLKAMNKKTISETKYSQLKKDLIPNYKRRPKRIGNVQCKICKQKLCDYTGVYDHVNKKHSRKKGVAEYIEELDRLKVEKCKICGIECLDRKKLILHEDREHANLDRLRCSKCEKSFKNLPTLRSHVRLMHLQDRTLSLCHLCSASFKSSTTLKQHIDQVHLGNKYFECDVCSKRFYNASQLRRHCRIHNLPESQKHECPTCGKRFVFAHNLKKHLQVVHSTHKESYHCPYCGKGFGQKGGMLSHIQLVHFNIFPYSCKECKASFARSVMLIEHMKSYHKEPDFQVTEKPVKNGIYNKTAEDMFYCSYCKEGFLHKTRLVEHMHTDHSEAFPCRCDTCDQGFLEKSFLVVHKMKAHGILITECPQEDSEKENNRKNEILQVITAKDGYPSKIVQFGLQETSETLEMTEEEVSDFQQQTQDETLSSSGTTAGSYLLMDVVSGDSTCRYVIETPDSLGDGGSVTVAQDIANLLLAAEQSIKEADEEGTTVDGTTEINLVIDGNHTVEEDNTYIDQGETEVEAVETLYSQAVEVKQTGEGELSYLQTRLDGTEGEVEFITQPSGDGKTILMSDLDLLQLAAMETVNASEMQEETMAEADVTTET